MAVGIIRLNLIPSSWSIHRVAHPFRPRIGRHLLELGVGSSSKEIECGQCGIVAFAGWLPSNAAYVEMSENPSRVYALGREDARFDFISGISSYHVQNGNLAARVVFKPSINFEDEIVYKDDFASISYHCFNLISRHMRQRLGLGCAPWQATHGGR